MHVILRFRSNLFCGCWSAKFILRLLECKIYFAVVGVQNLFCDCWSAKFILRLLECKIYFANARLECKINFALQDNGKINFALQVNSKINFALQANSIPNNETFLIS